MPPKKTSTRLDITLQIALVERLRAFADREGVTVSSVISQAVRSHLDGGASPSSSKSQRTLSPDDIDSLISQRVAAALQEHLSKLTLPANVTPEISVPAAPGPESVSSSDVPVTEPAPERVRAPVSFKTEKPIPVGKVPVPEDIRKKTRSYTAAYLANTIHEMFNPDNNPDIKTITRGTLQGFVKGASTVTSPEYCEQIVKAIEYLESQKADRADLSEFE